MERTPRLNEAYQELQKGLQDEVNLLDSRMIGPPVEAKNYLTYKNDDQERRGSKSKETNLALEPKMNGYFRLIRCPLNRRLTPTVR